MKMTVFEAIHNMNKDEFAKWLAKHGDFDDSPWLNWFNENYCSKCESIETYCEFFKCNTECLYCELEHKCKYFPDMESEPDNLDIIKMWLDTESKEEVKKND